MKGVAVGLAQLWFVAMPDLVLEIRTDPALAMQHAVPRPGARNRVAQRADDFASRQIASDSLAHMGEAEIGRRHFAGDRLVSTAPEIGTIPIDPLGIEHVEKMSFLGTLRQTGAMVKHAMQPGGAGARRTDHQKVWQSRDASAARLTVCGQCPISPALAPRMCYISAAAKRPAPRGLFQADRSRPSISSSASTSGRKRSRSRRSSAGSSGPNSPPPRKL